jgi:type I restriction enzyme S subunit
MPYGLKDIELQKLSEVFASKERIERVVLYGSRAKGNYKPFSDVDITLIGQELTHTDLNRTSLAIDDLLLPYQFDISIFRALKNENLIAHIHRVGITIYERKNEWKEYKLGEIANVQTGPFGSQLHMSDYQNEGTPIITVEHLGDNRIIHNNLPLVGDEDKNRLSKYVLSEGDIVFSRVGSVDRRAYVSANEDGWMFSGRCLRVRPSEEVDSKYLSYYFGLEDFKETIRRIAVGATMPSINTSILSNVVVTLPSLEEQHRIASILTSLDDKIDLLRRENATLEAMAETLFRQWFVVEAKEEWEEGKLGDLIEVKYGKDHKKLLDGKIPVIGSGGIMRYADTALYNKESVLIPRKGTLNNVMYINEPFWTVDTMFYTEMRRPNIAKFVFHFMKCQDLANMNVGSAVPSMTTEVLNNIPIDIPPQEVFDRFENAVASLYNKKEQNNKQIQTLIQTRDGLLPRLMGGEIKI